MGIHDKSLQLLEWFFSKYPSTTTVLELGSQNFYQTYGSARYGQYGDVYYKLKGIKKYDCIDLNGENKAKVLDLSKPIDSLASYDLVTDFGTQEHISPTMDIEALYNCWTTKYNAALHHIISVNPKTGHWPKHGAYFFTMAFYQVLARLTGLKILRLEEHFAMGNSVDGWEVACVFEKTDKSHWITLDEFREAFANVKPQ
jgi:hypothetical protein